MTSDLLSVYAVFEHFGLLHIKSEKVDAKSKLLLFFNHKQVLCKSKSKYRETILANCYNKFVFGNNSPEDNDWWSKELAEKREWDFKFNYDTEKVKYDSKYNDANLKYKPNFTPGKIQSLGAKQCYYKLKGLNGKSAVGIIKVDYLASKYHEQHESKQYNFNKFNL